MPNSDDPSSDIVHNERTKLTATYLNGLAIATFAVGGLAPIVALLSSNISPAPLSVMFAVSVGCLGASATLHSLGRRLLRGLR